MIKELPKSGSTRYVKKFAYFPITIWVDSKQINYSIFWDYYYERQLLEWDIGFFNMRYYWNAKEYYIDNPNKAEIFKKEMEEIING